MKFQVGDYFKVKASGITGSVIGIRTEIIAGKHAVEYYKVRWDHFSRVQEYEVDDVDSTDIWELIGGTVAIKVNQSIPFIPINIELSSLNKEWSVGHEKECSHDWTEYIGFRDSYKYCKKCDQKQKE